MSRTYSVFFNGTLANAGGDADLVYLAPADDKPVKVRGFKFGQTSELGDSAEEQLRVSIIRLPATVTVGSGGSAVTPSPEDSADTAAGVTARANDTTVATTSGSGVTLEEFSINIRAPFETWWPDRPAWKCKQGEAIVIRCQSTPADDISAQWTAIIEEE